MTPNDIDAAVGRIKEEIQRCEPLYNVRCAPSDLRLVLDALAEAERTLANERSTFSDYRPALVCEGCHRVVRALRDGLCDPCFLEGIPQ